MLSLLVLGSSARAEPRPVDRLVARVDGRPILLSDLMQRARPRVASVEPAWQRARALRELLGEERESAIRVELFAERARRRRIQVTDGDVEQALESIAASRKTSVPELLALAEGAGFSRTLYRIEIRRQLLEHRVLMNEPGAGGLEQKRERLLRELARRACIERFGRF